jgi:hypothetical protein
VTEAHIFSVEDLILTLSPAMPSRFSHTPIARVQQSIYERISCYNQKYLQSDDASTFFVADLGVVIRQHQRWQRCLPHVKPFYGMHEVNRQVQYE